MYNNFFAVKHERTQETTLFVCKQTKLQQNPPVDKQNGQEQRDHVGSWSRDRGRLGPGSRQQRHAVQSPGRPEVPEVMYNMKISFVASLLLTSPDR